MRQQKNIFQTKQQDKIPEEQLSEVEIGNLPEQECRVMIVKMIQDFRKRMEAWNEMMQEMFNRDLGDIQNRVEECSKRNEKIYQKKSTEYQMVQRNNSELGNREGKITRIEQKEKNIKKDEDNLKDLANNIKL